MVHRNDRYLLQAKYYEMLARAIVRYLTRYILTNVSYYK